MSLPFQTHELLNLKGVTHGFFGREGGVSKGQYQSLNVGRGSNDNPDHVSENRRRVAAALGTSRDNLLSLSQVHSNNVLIVESAWDYNYRPEADGLVTTQAGLAISALAADCGPVLFCDPETRVIGACHAGWRGAVSGITDSTIKAMETCGATRKNIRAVLGPCISGPNYEVGQDFMDNVLALDADGEPCFHTPSGGKPHFDLKAYLLLRLARAGLTQISALEDCTYAQPERYYSYRYNTHNNISDYGRQISSICLT